MKQIIFLIPLLFSSCATSTQSALLGASIGGGIGGGIGQLESGDFKGTAIGLAVGAGIGSLVGFLSHKEKEGGVGQTVTQMKTEGGEFPPLTKPKLKSMWVPDRIEGNKYIKGHFIYVIEDGGSWAN